MSTAHSTRAIVRRYYSRALTLRRDHDDVLHSTVAEPAEDAIGVMLIDPLEPCFAVVKRC